MTSRSNVTIPREDWDRIIRLVKKVVDRHYRAPGDWKLEPNDITHVAMTFGMLMGINTRFKENE